MDDSLHKIYEHNKEIRVHVYTHIQIYVIHPCNVCTARGNAHAHTHVHIHSLMNQLIIFASTINSKGFNNCVIKLCYAWSMSCVCLCMYKCIHACVCPVRVCVCSDCICAYVDVRSRMCACMYICLCVCSICVYLYGMHLCMLHVCVFVYAYLCIYVCMWCACM